MTDVTNSAPAETEGRINARPQWEAPNLSKVEQAALHRAGIEAVKQAIEAGEIPGPASIYKCSTSKSGITVKCAAIESYCVARDADFASYWSRHHGEIEAIETALKTRGVTPVFVRGSANAH